MLAAAPAGWGERRDEARLVERRVADRLRTERIELRRQMPVHPVGLDECHRRSNAAEQRLVDLARDRGRLGLCGFEPVLEQGRRRNRRDLRCGGSRCGRSRSSRCGLSGSGLSGFDAHRGMPVRDAVAEQAGQARERRGERIGMVLEELSPLGRDARRRVEVRLEHLRDVSRVQTTQVGETHMVSCTCPDGRGVPRSGDFR